MRGLHRVMPWTLLVGLLGGQALAQTQGSVYRCGSSYQSTPCPGGQAVAVDDSRSPTQRAQSQQVAQSERRLASELTRQRQAREAAAAAKAPAAPNRVPAKTDPAPKPSAPDCHRKAKHRTTPVGGCRDEVLYVDPRSVPSNKKASGQR